MDENKKEMNEDRVKIYDKEMYISQEKLKTIAIIIVIFIIGFIAGYFSNNLIVTNEKAGDNANESSYNQNVDN